MTGKITLYFESNREGEVEPCGCQVHQIGGLNRLEEFFTKHQKPRSLFVDAGDTFFSLGKLSEYQIQQEKIKAKLLAKTLKTFKLAALSPGKRDFAAGEGFLKELQQLTGAPFVLANLSNKKGERIFQPSVVVDVDGVKVGIVGLASPDLFLDDSDYGLASPSKNLEIEAKHLRRKGVHLVVVLSRLGLEADRKLAKMGLADVIVGSRSLDVLDKAVVVGKTIIVQPMNQGQHIGELTLDVNDPSKFEHKLIELDETLEVQNATKKAMEELKTEIRQVALNESTKAAPTSSERPFVAHPRQCRICHSKQYDFWATTKHASAYLVLFSKNQHFDPQCVGCHSLGFQQDGGFNNIARPIVSNGEPTKSKLPFMEVILKDVFSKDPGQGALDSRVDEKRHAVLHKRYMAKIHSLEEEDKVKQLFMGVQCEHCHGNRHGHPGENSKTVKKVSQATCVTCHRPPNAEKFNPKTFPLVACPLSGK